jgi:rhodanese-related sulfurtransferase
MPATDKQGSAPMLMKAFIIVLAAFLIGLLQNHDMMLYPSRFKEKQREEKLGKAHVISLEDTVSAFETGTHLFLDARSEEEFLMGHIPGALLVPAEDFDAYYPGIAQRLEKDRPMIAYCQDIDCDLAEKLKDLLEKKGFKGIRIFAEGWYGWAEFGLPIE